MQSTTKVKLLSFTILLNCLCVLSCKAEFSPDFHFFGSQSYVKSSKNDFIVPGAMNGSFALQEIGVNTSETFFDQKLYLGAQVLGRKFGSNNMEVELDWLKLGYQYVDQLNVSLGLLKNKFGFYNESRDIDASRTPVLAPQEIYAERLRDLVFASKSIRVDGFFDLADYGELSYSMNYGFPNIDNKSITSDVFNNLFLNMVPGMPIFTEYDEGENYGFALDYVTPINLSFFYQHIVVNLDYKMSQSMPLPLTFFGFPALLSGDKALELKNKIHYLGVRYEAQKWTLTSELFKLKGNVSLFGGPAQKGEDYEAYNIMFDYYWNNKLSSFVKLALNKHDGSAAFINDTESRNYCTGVRYDLFKYWTFKGEYHHFRGGYFAAGDGALQQVNTIGNWNAFLFRVSFNY